MFIRQRMYTVSIFFHNHMKITEQTSCLKKADINQQSEITRKGEHMKQNYAKPTPMLIKYIALSQKKFKTKLNMNVNNEKAFCGKINERRQVKHMLCTKAKTERKKRTCNFLGIAQVR